MRGEFPSDKKEPLLLQPGAQAIRLQSGETPAPPPDRNLPADKQEYVRRRQEASNPDDVMARRDLENLPADLRAYEKYRKTLQRPLPTVHSPDGDRGVATQDPVLEQAKKKPPPPATPSPGGTSAPRSLNEPPLDETVSPPRWLPGGSTTWIDQLGVEHPIIPGDPDSELHSGPPSPSAPPGPLVYPDPQPLPPQRH